MSINVSAFSLWLLCQEEKDPANHWTGKGLGFRIIWAY